MKVYTPKELAQIFQVIPVVVTRMIRQRKLSATKFGGSWRITQDQLDEYLEKRTLKAKK
jgi:excisionase family DNA binding protein